MKTSNFFIVMLFLILSSSCDKLNREPELMDPVYIELNAELSDIQKTKTAKEKEYAALLETMKNLEPRSREKRAAFENYFRLKNEMEKIDQKILYQRLRIHSRLVQDRQDYMEARRTNTVWPKPDSYENYKLQRKLASVPKIWTRGDAVKPVADKKKKDKKKEEKKEETN